MRFSDLVTKMGKLALTLGLTILATTARAAETRPNLLFILTDDQAAWTLSRNGNPNAQTPNMDRLAADGAYLPNSFTITPVCSPSRASLMTSRFGSELGITDWIKPIKNFKDTGNADDPQIQPALDPALPTFPRLLQQAGYATGLVGKYHLGEEPEHHPTKMGYGYFMGFLEGGTTPENPKLEKDGTYQPFEGLTMDILTDHALEFLEAHKDGPFLLSLHYRAPHTRWLPVAPEDWAPLEGLDPELPHPDYPGLDVERAKKMMREYLASVRGVDRNLGRVRAKLKELGVEDNTVVIFSADHGYNMAHNGIWHKGNGHWLLKKEALPPATENIPNGQRPNMYDNSLRVPTMVYWPGVTEPGQVVDGTVRNIDWFPTLLDMAGVELPSDAVIRGRSIVPLLKGQAGDWENDFFSQYSTKHQSHTDMRVWRSPEYKLIRDFLNEGRDEFYDLKADPQETANLINDLSPGQKEIVAKFDQNILNAMKNIGDPAVPEAEARMANP